MVERDLPIRAAISRIVRLSRRRSASLTTDTPTSSRGRSASCRRTAWTSSRQLAWAAGRPSAISATSSAMRGASRSPPCVSGSTDRGAGACSPSVRTLSSIGRARTRRGWSACLPPAARSRGASSVGSTPRPGLMCEPPGGAGCRSAGSSRRPVNTRRSTRTTCCGSRCSGTPGLVKASGPIKADPIRAAIDLLPRAQGRTVRRMRPLREAGIPRRPGRSAGPADDRAGARHVDLRALEAHEVGDAVRIDAG